MNFSLPVFLDAFDITMTYRHDSEVFIGYGSFVNKTTREEIKLNGFLQFDRKNHSFDSNLSKYKIAELSERPKGSNFANYG